MVIMASHFNEFIQRNLLQIVLTHGKLIATKPARDSAYQRVMNVGPIIAGHALTARAPNANYRQTLRNSILRAPFTDLI